MTSDNRVGSSNVQAYNWNQSTRFGTKKNVHVTLKNDEIKISVIQQNIFQRMFNEIARKVGLTQRETHMSYTFAASTMGSEKQVARIKEFTSKLAEDNPVRNEIEARMSEMAKNVYDATAAPLKKMSAKPGDKQV